MPGRSWITTSCAPFSLPSFFSTVTPGQLPTYWSEPVRSLKSVVLPQFGFPASAILILAISNLFPKKNHATSMAAASSLRIESS